MTGFRNPKNISSLTVRQDRIPAAHLNLKNKIEARLELAVKTPEWFSKLSTEKQKKYLKEHPNSKLARDIKARETDSKYTRKDLKKPLREMPAIKKKSFINTLKNNSRAEGEKKCKTLLQGLSKVVRSKKIVSDEDFDNLLREVDDCFGELDAVYLMAENGYGGKKITGDYLQNGLMQFKKARIGLPKVKEKGKTKLSGDFIADLNRALAPFVKEKINWNGDSKQKIKRIINAARILNDAKRGDVEKCLNNFRKLNSRAYKTFCEKNKTELEKVRE